ncbi:hypothetical protein [Halovenus sp. HT40]|uniref:hypothetical protein n=1 Tax=Halovenus sp. HT40 TaxID=3126691 RepID=UPI00300F19E2
MRREPGVGAESPVDHRTKPRHRLLSELRSQPQLFLPFLVAGLVTSLLGWLHRRDPIATVSSRTLADGHISLEYIGFPAGVRGTTLSVESVLGLKLPFLAWGISAYILLLAVHAIAGTVVIARVLGVEPTRRTVGSFFLYVACIDLIYRGFGSIQGFQNMPVVIGLPILVVWIYVSVRLFAVPGLIVTRESVTEAVQESWRLTQGYGWPLFGVILGLGLTNAVFALFSVVGPALSTALVGSVHAVYLGLFVDQFASPD